MIAVRDLTKRYGRFKALDGVCFDVAPGQAVGLWGPNGAGKTTTLKCLLGLVSFSGSISIDGLDVRRQGRLSRRRLGYVPQEFAYYDLTVAQTVDMFARLKRVDPAAGVVELEKVGLAGQTQKLVGALSGGMRQRLALALALLGNPPVLLLDEPTANLDALSRSELLQLLQSLKKDGKTLIFSSHRPDEIIELADQVNWLEGGRLAEICSPQRFRALLGLPLLLRISNEQAEPALAALAAAGITGADLRLEGE